VAADYFGVKYWKKPSQKQQRAEKPEASGPTARRPRQRPRRGWVETREKWL